MTECIAERQQHLDEREEFERCERLMSSIISVLASENADASTSFHALLLLLGRAIGSIGCQHCRKNAAETASRWLATADTVAPPPTVH
jgi:hypothetical protein